MRSIKKQIEELRDKPKQTEYESSWAVWDALIILAQAVDNLFHYKKGQCPVCKVKPLVYKRRNKKCKECKYEDAPWKEDPCELCKYRLDKEYLDSKFEPK